MNSFILIVVTTSHLFDGGRQVAVESVAMQRFADAQACQTASLHIQRMAVRKVKMVCLKERSAK